MLISSRTLGEYRAMFALTEVDLARRILDCPGGTASFTAEVNAAGGNAIACDPVYAQHSADELAALSVSETERGNGFVRAHLEQYRWSFFADPGEHLRSRMAAGARFAVDMRSNPNRYVTGGLPALPFVPTSFDLVLSSHLLFSYADRLDLPFHRAAIRELMQVSRDELRIFPLVAMGSAVPYPLLDELLDQLAEHDVTARVVAVDYEFQAGGNQMLVCRRASSRADRKDDHVAR